VLKRKIVVNYIEQLKGRIVMAIPLETISGKNNVVSMIEWLASFGATTNGGVTRLLYSKAWVQAQQALQAEMKSIGLDAYFDSVGNLFGRLDGTESDGKTILTGSHIDTVVDGGKYDGAYGVIASLLAVKRLKARYGTPKKTIEVVSLCEEEGSRFPLTFWGSRNIQGAYSLNQVRVVKDSEGVSFLDAMREAGFPPENYESPKRQDIERFVEVHIEQGVVLEKNKKSLGIVSHIVGQRRFTITIVGESNHAGTTPMYFRRDAVSVASELITFLTKRAQEIDSHLVATVGKIVVKPNVPNVVAGEIEFSLDIRHHQEEVLQRYCQELFAYMEEKVEKAGMTIAISKWMDVKPVELNHEMNTVIQQLADTHQISYQNMISGAGHDSQVFGSFCPTNLIFIPSHNGISHSPKEFTSVEDLETGIKILSEILYKLAY